MTELDTRCLDAFPLWIRSLAEDATALAQLLSTDSLPQDARSFVAGGLNYVFKSLDLIPTGSRGSAFSMMPSCFASQRGSRWPCPRPKTPTCGAC